MSRYVHHRVTFVSSDEEAPATAVTSKRSKRKRPTFWDSYKKISPLKYISTSEEEVDCPPRENSKSPSSDTTTSNSKEKLCIAADERKPTLTKSSSKDLTESNQTHPSPSKASSSSTIKIKRRKRKLF